MQSSARVTLRRAAIAGVAFVSLMIGLPMLSAKTSAPITVAGLPGHIASWTVAPASGRITGVPVRNFGVVDPGCLYRSAQPEGDAAFRWLQKEGFRSIVCLRSEHDDGAENLKQYGFDYLYLPILNEHAPSDEQARTFLAFVRDPHHWPILIHCKDGIGRASTLAALVRYSIDGWTMNAAMREAQNYRPFHFPMFGDQRHWLNQWKDRFAAGEYHPSKGLPDQPVASAM